MKVQTKIRISLWIFSYSLIILGALIFGTYLYFAYPSEFKKQFSQYPNGIEFVLLIAIIYFILQTIVNIIYMFNPQKYPVKNTVALVVAIAISLIIEVLTLDFSPNLGLLIVPFALFNILLNIWIKRVEKAHIEQTQQNG